MATARGKGGGVASARKKFKAKGNLKPGHEPSLYAAFAADLLSGAVKATKLVEVRQGNKLDLEYDDPNG